MSGGQYSASNWRQAPQDIPPSRVATAIKRNTESPSESALNKATRSPHTHRPSAREGRGVELRAARRGGANGAGRVCGDGWTYTSQIRRLHLSESREFPRRPTVRRQHDTWSACRPQTCPAHRRRFGCTRRARIGPPAMRKSSVRGTCDYTPGLPAWRATQHAGATQAPGRRC